MLERCQKLLTEDEHITREAEATCKLGLLSEFGAGKAYLTERRFIWVRRSSGVIRRALFWIPDVIEFPRSGIKRLQMKRQLTRAWLIIDVNGAKYSVRLGEGPYPMLRNNPETTEAWYKALAGEAAA